MSRGARLALVSVLFAGAVGLMVFAGMSYLRRNPPNVDYIAGHVPGTPVHLTLQTVGTMGHGAHPTWVSYLAKAPDGRWVHSTLWQLPAHTRIDVTLYEYDGATPLRNQTYGRVTGVGTSYRVNGRRMSVIKADSTSTGVAHTFTVPRMGINIPLYAVPSSAKNTCSVAPCHRSTSAHEVITFHFNSGAPGQYRWQCFIPCGADWLDGNGGPMQTIGYMGGFLKVSA
jgi:hypothetical protein